MPAILKTIARPLPSALLVVLVGAALYARTLAVPFLYDDIPAIVQNTTIRSLGDVRAVLTPPSDTSMAGRPTSNATLALNYATTRLELGGLHAMNIAIHLLAGLVLLWLTRQTLLRLGRERDQANAFALLLALAWVVHPLQTESVTYLVQRTESLAALGLLLTLAASLQLQATRSPLWALAAIGACAAGLGAKETAVVTPVVVVLYDRAFLFTSVRAALRERGWFYGALAATWIPFAWLVEHSNRGQSAGLKFSHFTPWLYLKYQAGALVHYLRLVVWPSGLTFDYGEAGAGVPSPAHVVDWLLPGVLVLGLLVAAVWSWRRSPALGFLGLVAFILLAPSSSVVPVITEVIAEHRLYLALAPLLCLALLGVERFLPSVWIPVSAAAIVALALLTVQRNELYRSRISLWTDTVQKRPANARAWVELGSARTDAGDRAGGDRAYEEAVRLDADYPSANFGLGISAALRGDCQRAIHFYERALMRRQKKVEIHYNYAVCLDRLGRPADAITEYGIALDLTPEDAEVHLAYSEALDHAGRLDDAFREAQRAAELRPDWANAHYELANLLIRSKRLEESRLELEAALKADPTLVLAHHRLGRVDAALGRLPQAVDELKAALALDPRRASAIEDLVWLRATVPAAESRNGSEAVEWTRKLEALLPALDAHALDVTAAAMAETGQFDEAVQREVRALEVARAPSATLVEGMRAREALYRQRLPYREPPSI